MLLARGDKRCCAHYSDGRSGPRLEYTREIKKEKKKLKRKREKKPFGGNKPPIIN